MARVLLPVLLFALGGAAALAATHGLYANVAVLLLLGGWTWLAMLADGRRRRGVAVEPAPLPDRLADQLREHRRLTAYLNLSPAPLVTMDEEGRMSAVNRAARRLFASEDRIAVPPPGLSAAIAAAMPGRSSGIRLDIAGTPHDFALATADLTSGGTGARIVALVDIGAELRAVEANALRDLLQVLSHEIMNALTPIASLGRTAADMLADPGSGDTDPVRDAVETIARRAEGLHRFASSYRDLARLPPPDRRPADLGQVLTDLARLFAERWPTIALEVEAPARLQVRADADQIAAALWAVAQNAAEAVAERPAPAVRVHAIAATDSVSIAISDNGPGIADSVQADVFRPFFTTKPGGSGVGLALARQIALAHHGALTVEQSETGARLRFVFPTR